MSNPVNPVKKQSFVPIARSQLHRISMIIRINMIGMTNASAVIGVGADMD
jgi:hypothetical protein